MHYDVVIVGAGISGLAAACWLRSKRISVLVLEARPYIGGRVVTDRSAYPPLDLGASWVHGSKGNPLTELAQCAHLHLLPYQHRYGLVDREHSSRRIDTKNLENRISDLLERTIGNTPTTEPCISLERAVQKIIHNAPEIQGALLSSITHRLALIAGGDPDDVSSCFAIKGGSFTGSDMWFPDGYNGIVRALADGIEFSLTNPVLKINHTPHEVMIETQSGEFRARAAIVTIPLGVLQKETTLFNPQLPGRKKGAIEGLRMGVIEKTILCFNENNESESDHLMPLDDKDVYFNSVSILHISPQDHRVIFWSAGRKAQRLEELEKPSRIESASCFLSSLTGRGVSFPVRTATTSWRNDPFARGSYSFVPANQSISLYDIMAEPVNNTLFFAGESTFKADPGTVHGAYLSGIREAHRVYEVVSSH